MIFTKELFAELEEYVNKHIGVPYFAACEDVMYINEVCNTNYRKEEMENFIKDKKKPSFCNVLLKHIDMMSASDSEIYKKAGIDRRHFSKIRSNPEYHPSKNTAIALALALKLNQKEANKLIGAAGYTISDSETFDLVITFCLEKKIYDIHDVNLALDYFSLKPITGAIE